MSWDLQRINRYKRARYAQKENNMEPIKNNDNEKIEEIKDIEKNGMRELSDEELEGVAGGFGFNAFRTPDFEPDWSH